MYQCVLVHFSSSHVCMLSSFSPLLPLTLALTAACPPVSLTITLKSSGQTVFTIYTTATPVGQWYVQTCPKGWDKDPAGILKVQCQLDRNWNQSSLFSSCVQADNAGKARRTWIPCLFRLCVYLRVRACCVKSNRVRVYMCMLLF